MLGPAERGKSWRASGLVHITDIIEVDKEGQVWLVTERDRGVYWSRKLVRNAAGVTSTMRSPVSRASQ